MNGERTKLRDDARWVVALVLATASTYLLLGLLSLVVLLAHEGQAIPGETLSSMQAGSAIELVLFLVGAVAWLIWQRRFNLRLRALGREGMRFSPGWSVAWYFVPFANFVLPPQVMQESWQASDPDSGATEWKDSRPSSLVYAWWSTFIIGNIVSRAGLTSGLAGDRNAPLLTDALSAVLVVTAGILAVILIRRLEARMRELESGLAPAEERPRTGQAIAGALIGALVGLELWLVVPKIALAIGVSRGLYFTVLYVTAAILGLAVGFWTLLGAGGRHRGVTIVAAIATFFALFNGAFLAFSPAPLLVLRDLLTRMPFVLRYVGGMLTDPLLLGAALLATATAVVMTLAKLPIEMWRIAAPEEAAPVPAPAPSAQAPEVPAIPLESTAVATVAEEPPSLSTATAPSKRNRMPIFALLAGAVVLAIAVGAFALGHAASSDDEPKQAASSSTSPAPAETPEAAEPEAPQSNAIPEDIIVTLYDAAARGDAQAAAVTYAPGFDLDAGMLSNWGDPDYEISEVTAGSTIGEIKVEVFEPGGGLSDGDVVTWTLREQTEGWRVSGWFLGRIEDDPDFAGDVTAPGTGAQLSEEQATNALALFLQWRMTGSQQDMRNLATVKMYNDQPEVFSVEPGAFTAFYISSARAEGDAWVLEVEETWNTGTQTYEYVVIEQGGAAWVDEQR